MVKIGEYLAEKRAETNEMQKDQAARLGLDPSSLIHYSNGRNFGKKILQRIIDEYGKTPEEVKKIYRTQVTQEEIDRAEIALQVGADKRTAEDLVVWIKYGI
jgi:transcriptional regulator with XRE-family HTH domain